MNIGCYTGIPTWTGFRNISSSPLLPLHLVIHGCIFVDLYHDRDTYLDWLSKHDLLTTVTLTSSNAWLYCCRFVSRQGYLPGLAFGAWPPHHLHPITTTDRWHECNLRRAAVREDRGPDSARICPLFQIIHQRFFVLKTFFVPALVHKLWRPIID